VGGRGEISTHVASLVDTNLLVYRFDPRFPEKQETAIRLLRTGVEHDSIRIPHQAIVEFVAAVSRTRKDGPPLLEEPEAWREAENLLDSVRVLYPTEAVLRTAFRGAAVYRLSWFDAHIWAYAECFDLPEIYSEDFQHGRMYGKVRATNPFLARS
jgi:predicted nucleic acid-binding protein